MDKSLRDKVLDKMTTERDLRNQMAYARKEAIEEGHAEGLAAGLAEGRAEGRAEVINKMLAAGIPTSTIANALGISIEECEAYRKTF